MVKSTMYNSYDEKIKQRVCRMWRIILAQKITRIKKYVIKHVISQTNTSMRTTMYITNGILVHLTLNIHHLSNI